MRLRTERRQAERARLKLQKQMAKMRTRTRGDKISWTRVLWTFITRKRR